MKYCEAQNSVDREEMFEQINLWPGGRETLFVWKQAIH